MIEQHPAILPQLAQLTGSDTFRTYVDSDDDWVEVCNRLKALTSTGWGRSTDEDGHVAFLFEKLPMPVPLPGRCETCSKELYSHRFESTGPYLYCATCGGGPHPLPVERRMNCDEDAYCHHAISSLAVQLVRKAFGVILIERSCAFNRRAMTVTELEHWNVLEGIRRQCLRFLGQDHSPLPEWYSGVHASEHKQVVATVQHQLLPNGVAPLLPDSPIAPLSCPRCYSVPSRYDRPNVEYHHDGNQLSVSVSIPLKHSEHSWDAVASTVSLTITDESEPDKTLTDVRFWQDELTGLALSVTSATGDLVVFSLDSILERLLFGRIGWSGSYSESSVRDTVSASFTSIEGFVNTKRGLVIRVSPPRKWYDYLS